MQKVDENIVLCFWLVHFTAIQYVNKGFSISNTICESEICSYHGDKFRILGPISICKL